MSRYEENALTDKSSLDKKALRLFPIVLIFFETTLYLSNDMYLPGMPAIAGDLQLTQNQVQATLTAWFLGASSLQLILGPLSDSHGRKNIVLASCFVFILSSIACALSDNLTFFLIARFLQGTSICALLAAYAAVHELYKTKDAIKLLAIVNSVTILAPALGPLFGALIVEFVHWRYIFWFLSALGMFSLFSIIVYMPESNHARHHINVKQTIRDYLNIINNKGFFLPSVGYFLLIVIEFTWIFESPFIIIEIFNYDPMFYGYTQAVIFGFYFVGALVTKWFLDRFTVTQFIEISLSITILGTTIFLITAIFYNSLMWAIFSMILISLGTSMLFGPLNRTAIEACKEPMGRRMAIFSMGVSLAGFFTGLILSVMNTDGLIPISMLMMGCMIVSAILICSSIKSDE